MQKLYYAGGHVILADTVCSTLIGYARALANAGQSDLVIVPALSDEGLRGQSELLIGPASQLFASAALERPVDLDDPDAVASMREKTARLQLSRPVPERVPADDDELYL